MTEKTDAVSDRGTSETSQETEVYCAFSLPRKMSIVALASISGMLSPLTANIYFPATPAIQADMGTTTEMVNLTVTTYMIFQGLAPTFWCSLSDVWGRRPVYLSTMVVYLGACVGLALAPVFWLLIVLRMLQAFGSSSVIALGFGVISDVAVPAERGTYMGICTFGQMFAPSIGPVVGGVIAEKLSWRWVFWILVIFGGILFVCTLFFLPETLRSLVGNGTGSRYINPTPTQWIKSRRRHSVVPEQYSSTFLDRLKTRPNFLEPVYYVLQPDIALILLFVGCVNALYYAYLVSLPSLFTNIYGLNQLESGLCFLSQGAGCIVGTLVVGRVLDYDFRMVTKRLGYPVESLKSGNIPPEFPLHRTRLRPVWVIALLMQAIAISYGWCLYAKAHMAAPLILQFLEGICAMGIMSAMQVLLVDLFPGKGASIGASSNLVRCIMGAISSVSIEPGINGVGVGWMFTILGLIGFAFNGLLLVLVKKGPKWHAKRLEKRNQQ